MGSEPSAAGGGCSEANESQRSEKSRRSESPKIFPGTASGSALPSAEGSGAENEAAGTEFRGKGAAEKKEIHERLQRFRKDRGLGCFGTLAKATNGVVEADQIREMLNGARAPLATWKIVNAAMDYIEGKEKEK